MNDQPSNTAAAIRVTWIGIVVNLVLMLFKLAAGILGRSRAMIADAVESLGDLPANLVVLFGIILAGRPPDKTHDYGHGKIETLSSTAVGLLLIAAGVWIFGNGAWNVWGSFRGGVIPRPGWIAFWGTLVAITVKEWLYRYTVRVGRKINSQAVMANAWHHRADAITSVGTLAGIGGAIFLGERWRLLDPLAAVIVSLFIVRTGWSITREGLDQLLEASEPDDKENQILGIIGSIPGVNNPHRLKTRRIGNQTAVDIHVEVDKSMTVVEAHDIADRIEMAVRDSFGEGTLISVHVEPLGYRQEGGGDGNGKPGGI